VSDSRTRSRADRRRARDEPGADKRPLAPDLKVVETQVFRGPNYWSYDPAIRLLFTRLKRYEFRPRWLAGVANVFLRFLGIRSLIGSADSLRISSRCRLVTGTSAVGMRK